LWQEGLTVIADPKDILPGMDPQNPAPFTAKTQDHMTAVRSQVDRIVAELMRVLPSNYVSQTTGPFYTMEFQAAAEQLAEFQITAQELLADWSTDFTRSEVLFQILGALVFPNATTADGWPQISGDVSYRTFLQRMVTLLLQGSTKDSVKGGVEALTNATVEIIERALAARQMKTGCAWGPADQFTFEINVSDQRPLEVTGETHTFTGYTESLNYLGIDAQTVQVFSLDRSIRYYGPSDFGVTQDFDLISEMGSTPLMLELTPESRLVIGSSVLVDYIRHIPSFPANPFTLQHNVQIVLRALRPAHTLYDYRYLFREIMSSLIQADVQVWDMSRFEYEDSRRYWLGVYAITGSDGVTLSDRSLFRDYSRDFSAVPTGATLSVLTGANQGEYQVQEVRVFPVGDDPTPRLYTTIPTGLTGYATVLGSDVFDIDPTHDFSAIEENEILVFHTGPNAGSYRISVLLGLNGGVVGQFSPPPGSQYTSVRLSASLLRVKGWMSSAARNQEYRVTVDRLGVQSPNHENEDASAFFCR